jgi:hypothetical protein
VLPPPLLQPARSCRRAQRFEGISALEHFLSVIRRSAPAAQLPPPPRDDIQRASDPRRKMRVGKELDYIHKREEEKKNATSSGRLLNSQSRPKGNARTRIERSAVALRRAGHFSPDRDNNV